MKLPIAKNDNLVVQEYADELLIYNLITHKAYRLNGTAKIVYQACNGKTSFTDLKNKHKFTDNLIYLALDELKKDNLLENDKTFVSPLAGMSRREAIRHVGLATMIALPVVSSLIAPTAAMAQSVSCTGTQPNGFLICTRGEPGCLINIAQSQCASCRAAVITGVPGCSDPFPVVCSCVS